MEQAGEGKAAKPWFFARPVLFAVAAQGVLVLVAVFVVVIVPSLQDDPDFSAARTIYLPQRELQHRMSMAEFQQNAQPPVMLERLATSALLPDTMPRLPALPSVDAAVPDTPLLDANALLGQSGILAALAGTSTEVSTVSFFGVEDQAQRIVICFDISTTVKNKVERAGYTMEVIRAETESLIEGLNANTLFGIIQHARNYDLFRDYLVPATRGNKEAARQWLRDEFRTDGMSARGWRRGNPNGIQSVLAAAFRLDPAPDLVILVSDGDYHRTVGGRSGERVPWREITNDLNDLQEGLVEPARLHFIGFHMRASDRNEANRLTRLFNGTFREFR